MGRKRSKHRGSKKPIKGKKVEKETHLTQFTFREIKPIVKFILSFIVLVFVLMLFLNWFMYKLHVPYEKIIATVCSLALNFIGLKAEHYGTVVNCGSVTGNIIPRCNGLDETAVFLSAIIAYPASLRGKIAGIALGLIGIFTINILRLVIIFIAGLIHSEWFEIAHFYIGQTLVIIFAFGLWMVWEQSLSQWGQPKN